MKWLVGLIGTGVVVLVAFVVLVIAFGQPGASTHPAYPHSLLERDRVMTERMAVQTYMAEEGMLQRSADPAYVAALEDHVRWFDRMLGRTP